MVAVGARLDEEALAQLRGNVRLTLEAGGRRDRVEGRLNPAFRPCDPLILRREDTVTRDALLIGCDRGSDGLDRALGEAVARDGERVTLSFAQIGGYAPGLLVVDPGAAWGSRRGHDVKPSVSSPLADADRDAALRALAEGDTVAATLSLHDDAVASDLVAAAHAAGHDVLPVDGLPPAIAALAAAGAPMGRVEIAGRGRLRPLEAGTVRLALGVPGDRVDAYLAGAERGLVTLDPGAPREQHLPRGAGDDAAIPGGRDRVAIVVAIAPPAVEDLEPRLASLVGDLLQRGVSKRDAAHAVQAATGLSRSRAYDAVLALGVRAETSSVDRPDPRTSR